MRLRRKSPRHEFELRQSRDPRERVEDIFWFRCSCGKSGNGNATPSEAEADFDEHVRLHEQRHRFVVETDGTKVGAVRTNLSKLRWVSIEEVKIEAVERGLGRARGLYGLLVTTLLIVAVIGLMAT